jgi:endoglucanase
MYRWLFPAAALMAFSGFTQTAYLRGVNISGAEFGSNSENGGGTIQGFLGSTYTYQSAPTFDYFAVRGLPFIRLEVLWERLQPTPGGPLVPGLANDNLGFLKQDVAWAKAAGAQVSIVLQNYGRYTVAGSQTACVIDNPCNGSSVLVSGADLADFWSKMAAVFVDEPAVVAYDMMNEPHDMGVANWNQISQQVVNAIRMVDSNKLIMVPGNSWSNATNWASDNGPAWISDPAGNFWYEGHEYFDHDYSGSYQWTYDQELAANPDLPNIGVTRLTPFVQWCTNNNVKCYLGEYGIPNDGPALPLPSAQADARWLTVLDNFLTQLDAAGMPGTYWAGGEWWGNYPLSIQPIGFSTDREQLQTLLNHLQPDLLRTASAAASYGYNVAPNSLVAGYGSGLAPAPMIASIPLPTQLGDTQVQVTDSAGNVSFAPLLYVSGRQVNYQLPSTLASGLAKVSVLDNGMPVSNGILQVQPIAPGIISANSTGYGVAAAFIQRVLPDGTLPPLELAATYSTAQGEWVPNPISFNGDQLILELFGTGLDKATTSDTTVTINGIPVVVNYAGVQGTWAGEDQINVQLPTSLAGSGEVPVQVFAAGVSANQVTVTFQ